MIMFSETSQNSPKHIKFSLVFLIFPFKEGARGPSKGSLVSASKAGSQGGEEAKIPPLIDSIQGRIIREIHKYKKMEMSKIKKRVNVQQIVTTFIFENGNLVVLCVCLELGVLMVSFG